MSRLSQRIVSRRRIAANRQNALKSTGPRTPEGKRRSRYNNLKRGLAARLLHEAMKALGEDPREFERLRRNLRETFEPANAAESLLVEDLARLWWKKARSERAQSGVHVRDLEQMETRKLRGWHEINRSLDITREELREVGLRHAPDCAGKFEDALNILELLEAHLQGRTRCDSIEDALTALYGHRLTWRGAVIAQLFEEIEEEDLPAGDEDSAETQDGAPEPKADEEEALPADPEDDTPEPQAEDAERALSSREHLHLILLEEIRDVISEHETFLRERVEISRAARDANLAPTDSRWTWMLRQENFLDRNIDRKLKMLLKLQSLRGKGGERDCD